jgi:hypothetical protein
MRIATDESPAVPLVGRLPSRLDERLLSRIAGIRMWFAAKARQVMAYRIQTDPQAVEVNRASIRPPDISIRPLVDPPTVRCALQLARSSGSDSGCVLCHRVTVTAGSVADLGRLPRSRYRAIPGMPIAVRQMPRESRADRSSAARDPSSAEAPANLRPREQPSSTRRRLGSGNEGPVESPRRAAAEPPATATVDHRGASHG